MNGIIEGARRVRGVAPTIRPKDASDPKACITFARELVHVIR
jgi:hypothetical protein